MDPTRAGERGRVVGKRFPSAVLLWALIIVFILAGLARVYLYSGKMASGSYRMQMHDVGPISAVAFVSEPQLGLAFCTGGEDGYDGEVLKYGVVGLWDFKKGSINQFRELPKARFTDIAITSDGSIACVSKESIVCIIGSGSSTSFADLRLGPLLSIAPILDHIAVAGSTPGVLILDRNAEIVRQGADYHKEWITSIATSSERVISAGWDKSIVIEKRTGGGSVAAFDTIVNWIAMSKSGRMLAIGLPGRTLIWNIEVDGDIVQIWQGPTADCGVWSDEDLFLGLETGQVAKLRVGESMSVIRRTDSGFVRSAIFSLAITEDGRYLAIGFSDGVIEVLTIGP